MLVAISLSTFFVIDRRGYVMLSCASIVSVQSCYRRLVHSLASCHHYSGRFGPPCSHAVVSPCRRVPKLFCPSSSCKSQSQSQATNDSCRVVSYIRGRSCRESEEEVRGCAKCLYRGRVRIGSHTNRIVFQHAHRQRGTGPGEGVKVTRHGHGDEAHVDDAGLGCLICLHVCQSTVRSFSAFAVRR